MNNEAVSKHTHTCMDCGREWECPREHCRFGASVQCPECTDKELAKREARQEVLTGAFPTGRTPSKRPAFKWRAECVKGYMKRFDWDVISQRLTSALYKGRINPMEYERLEKLLEASWEDVGQAPPLSDFSEPDRYLLWQARILQRDLSDGEGVWRWFAAWVSLSIVCFGASATVIHNFLSATEISLPDLLFFDPDESMPSEVVLSLGVTIVIVRMIYNRRYKGEWLPDEALASVKFVLVCSIFPFIVWSPVSIFLGGSSVLRVGITLGVFIGSFLVLHCILWLFGRRPYSEFNYPWSLRM